METGSGQVVVSLETPPSTLVGTESRVTDGPIQTGALTQRTPSCLGSASTALWTAGQTKGAKVSGNTGEAPASGGTPQFIMSIIVTRSIVMNSLRFHNTQL